MSDLRLKHETEMLVIIFPVTGVGYQNKQTAPLEEAEGRGERAT